MVKDYLEGDFEAPSRRRTALTTRRMMGGRSSCAPLAVMGQTAMTQSLPRGVAVARYLISRGADVNYQCPSGAGPTPHTGQLRHLVTLRKWFTPPAAARRRQ